MLTREFARDPWSDDAWRNAALGKFRDEFTRTLLRYGAVWTDCEWSRAKGVGDRMVIGGGMIVVFVVVVVVLVISRRRT